MRILVSILWCLTGTLHAWSQSPSPSPVSLRVFPVGELPQDERLGELRNLNGYFPFQQFSDSSPWLRRQAAIQRRILISQGLWPLPSKTPLNAAIHGRVEREDYVVDRVYFESIPGHYVTGSLYRPQGKEGPFPAILSPHGHWQDGRFYDAGEKAIRASLAAGAERFEIGGRFHIQARAVQLARMGCVVFLYDTTGNADSIQLPHRHDENSHLDRSQDWGFFSAQAELRLQNMMGLQTWNSMRAIDFLLELDETDPTRIGVTGASGGGTQSMIIAAIDPRITAAMPCVMVSTSMQGGCSCENAPYLRIDQGNVDIAAAIAPRPLGVTAADDWTIELETKGYPDLQRLYTELGQKHALTAAFNTHFKHNYNHVNRTVMYGFFNRHFQLGWDAPVLERDFIPLTYDEATVWTAEHPAPSGDAVGDAHEIKILKLATKDAEANIVQLIPDTAEQADAFRHIVGGAWETMLGRRLDQVAEVTFQPTKQLQVDALSLTLGRLNHLGEQLPLAELRASQRDIKGTVIWLTDQGKAGLWAQDAAGSQVRDLAKAGYRVLAADLFQQGEFLDSGEPVAAQRMWYQRRGEQTWERYAAYTFGYNHPLFSRRVHDVLTTIKHAQASSDAPVHLVGIGSQAGAIVAAARSQAGVAVGRTFIDTEGFRFESLQEQNDPMFVPGAVRYLDIDGILALCVPGPVDVVGAVGAVVQRVDGASNVSGTIRSHANREEWLQAMQRELMP